MANLQELQALLKEAHAAGDTRNTELLLNKIEEIKGTQTAPEAPQQGGFSAYQQELKSQIEASGKGLIEGGRRFVGGAGQAIAAGETMLGTMTEEEYQDLSFEEAKRRHAVEQEDWWKESITGQASAFVGELVPWFAFKMRGTTPMSRIGEAVAWGGIGGAAQFTTEEDERLGNILLGSGMGLTGQSLVDLRPRQMFMRRQINQAMNDPFFADAVARSEKLGKEGATLTFAEMTEHPWFIQLQRVSMTARQAPAWKQHRIRALEKTDAALKKNLKAVYGEDVTPEQAGAMIKSAYTAHMDNIYDTASKNYLLALDEVNKVIGGKAFINMDNVVREINSIIGEWSKSGSPAKVSAIKKLEFFRNSLQKAKYSPEGTIAGREARLLTAKEAKNKFQSWGQAARGKGKVIFHDDAVSTLDAEVAPRIYRAFMEGMDSQKTMLNENASRKAVEMFTAARGEYGKAMDYARSVKNSQIGVILEKAYQKTGSTADEAFHQVIGKLKPSELRSTLSIINDVEPQYVNMLKKRVIMDALDKAAEVGQRGEIGWDYDPSHLVRLLKKEGAGERGKAWSSVGVSMPKESEIRMLLKKMRKLAQFEPDHTAMTGMETQGQKVAGLMGDVASGSLPNAVFTATASFRPFWTNSKFVTNVLTSKEAREAVMALDNPKVGARLAQSIMTLTGLLNETELSQFNDRLEAAQKNPYMFSGQKPTDVLRVSPQKMRSGEYVPRIR